MRLNLEVGKWFIVNFNTSIHSQITEGWVKKGSDQHWLKCGSAKILDIHPAFAFGFSLICVNLCRTFYCFNLHFFGSRLNLLQVFQVKISWNMGFCTTFQRFVLCRTDLLFVIGVWLFAWNNNYRLSYPDCVLCVGGLQERRIVKAAQIFQIWANQENKSFDV